MEKQSPGADAVTGGHIEGADEMRGKALERPSGRGCGEQWL